MTFEELEVKVEPLNDEKSELWKKEFKLENHAYNLLGVGLLLGVWQLIIIYLPFLLIKLLPVVAMIASVPLFILSQRARKKKHILADQIRNIREEFYNQHYGMDMK